MEMDGGMFLLGINSGWKLRATAHLHWEGNNRCRVLGILFNVLLPHCFLQNYFNLWQSHSNANTCNLEKKAQNIIPLHQSNFFVYWHLLLPTTYENWNWPLPFLDRISEKWITGLTWSDDLPNVKEWLQNAKG